MAKTDLGPPLRGFFEQHLLSQRGLSGHTVLAYRDALKLYLAFICRQQRTTTSALTLATVTRAVEGVYTVVASNRVDQVTSKPIVVTVSNVDPVSLVLLKWDGANAGPVALEVATQLTPSMTWSVLTNYPVSASPQTHLEAILPVSSRFYRLNAAQALRFSTAGHVNSWSITHPAGSRVLVEYSTSRVGWTNWLALTTLTLPSSPYPFVDEASLTEPSRVYRTSVVP